MASAPLSTLLPPTLVRGRRVGLFGGSFNPPHAGHLRVATEALRRLRLDEVWWIVALRNPLKPADILADFHQRLAATHQLAVHPRFRVLDIEARLGVSRTFDLLDALDPLLAQGCCVWVMGADSFAQLHRWHKWRQVMTRLPIAVFDRPRATLAALTSPAARAFAPARLPVHLASLLPDCAAPAWSFLSIPRHPESSTRQRATLASGAALGA